MGGAPLRPHRPQSCIGEEGGSRRSSTYKESTAEREAAGLTTRRRTAHPLHTNCKPLMYPMLALATSSVHLYMHPLPLKVQCMPQGLSSFQANGGCSRRDLYPSSADPNNPTHLKLCDSVTCDLRLNCRPPSLHMRRPRPDLDPAAEAALSPATLPAAADAGGGCSSSAVTGLRPTLNFTRSAVSSTLTRPPAADSTRLNLARTEEESLAAA